MKRASNRTAEEIEWFQTVAKAFQAVSRDAQGIAQGAKDLPSDGMLARFSQWEAEIDSLSPDNSAPLAKVLIREVDTLLGLAWGQGRIPDWKPYTPQGEVFLGMVAGVLWGIHGETLKELGPGRIDLMCRIFGSKLAEASAAHSVEAEHRAERLIARLEERKAKKRGVRGKAIPPEVKKAVLNFIDEEFGGDVRGEGGWKTAWELFDSSSKSTARVRQFVGSAQSMERIADAARTAQRRRQKK